MSVGRWTTWGRHGPRALAALLPLLAAAGCAGSQSDAGSTQAEAPVEAGPVASPEPPPRAPDAVDLSAADSGELLFHLSLDSAAANPTPEPPFAVGSEYRALAGWSADDHAAALPALRSSCDWFARNAPHRRIDYGDLVGTVADWHAICAEVPALSAAKADDVRVFFEQHFVPVAVGPSAQSDGLFTG